MPAHAVSSFVPSWEQTTYVLWHIIIDVRLSLPLTDVILLLGLIAVLLFGGRALRRAWRRARARRRWHWAFERLRRRPTVTITPPQPRVFSPERRPRRRVRLPSGGVVTVS